MTLLDTFGLAIIVSCICYVLVFIAIAIDLWSGVRKAKKAGIARMSSGYRKTLEKICKYYNSLFAVTVIDCFIMLLIYVFQQKGWVLYIPLFPISTVCVGTYIAFIEARSVFEKLEEKEKARISTDVNKLCEIIKEKDKLDKVIELLDKIK